MKWFTVVRGKIAYEVYAEDATRAYFMFRTWEQMPVEVDWLRRKKVTQRRPPKRKCRDCGGDVYAFPENPRCERCQKEQDELPHLDFRAMYRERRAAEQSSRPVPHRDSGI